MIERATSALGIVTIAAVAFLFCPPKLRRYVNWRTVGAGMAIQLLFAFLVLKTPVNAAFRVADGVVNKLLGFSREGAVFIFGNLVSDTNAFGFIFAFQILPTIIFFAALMAILYHVGIMPFVIRVTARAMARLLGTSGAESFSTAADIFVGQTEAPLVIRPYLPGLTRSELMACMTAGFATTAGGVLAAYVGMLQDFVPGIAGHLIAASVMCAPASIVIAKLMLPESAQPETLGDARIDIPQTDVNIVDAAARGTSEGLRLAANVGAMLIAFLALTAMINFGLHWAGGLAGLELSLQRITGWIFTPLAWVMGVTPADVTKVGGLIGEKMVLNEFVAYSRMGQELKATGGEWLSPRSQVIASYALCGFANFGSIGIQIGGYSGLAPERRGDLSQLALRAMLAGTLSTCMVASVAGLLL
jgi:concentrative nucleoside transporter, CNT family